MLDEYASHVIDDALRAKAFDQASAIQRACLKNAIAFHSLMGEGPSQIKLEQEFKPKGYALIKQLKPAPWLMCFCAESYISPARFIAALMPACMAQVPNILVIHVTTKPAMSLLLALELMGIEQAFALHKNNLVLLQDMFMSAIDCNETGRLLFLGQDANFAPMQQKAKDFKIPMWTEGEPPHIYCNIVKENENLLRWAQGDAQFCKQLEPNVQAVYGNFNDNATYIPMQQWADGMEACYVHEQLGQDFFKNTFLRARTLIDE